MNANSTANGNGMQAPDVMSLFAQAHQDGDLSGEALQILSVADLGAMIQAGLGVPALNVPSSRAVLLTMLLDDSGSIAYKGNEQVVRDGYNQVVKALSESRQAGEILAQTRYLNAGILYPYQFIANVPLLDAGNFRAAGYTPLYDRTIEVLGSVLAKTAEFAHNGVPVTTITLIVTDGHDEGSQYSARQVRLLASDMLAGESHIIAGMGITDGETDFRRVFRDMGIPDKWVLTPRNDPKEIRQAFELFSQSAVRASQSALTFSQTASSGMSVGGFGV